MQTTALLFDMTPHCFAVVCHNGSKHRAKLILELGGSVERITPVTSLRHVSEYWSSELPRILAMEGWARDISETGISAFVAQGLMLGNL